MNNNMPNNFNNGIPNNIPNNFNNGVPNNIPNNSNNGTPNNPVNGGLNVQQQAKEQLVGGQSAVGNGPSVMQGQSNVQNDRGVIQGMGNVSNNPGVMQGNAMPNKPEVPPVMPGQNHSGINAVTMQKEETKKDEPGVVSIPNFGSVDSESPKPEPVQSNPAPAPAPNSVNPVSAGVSNMNSTINNNQINSVNAPNFDSAINGPKPVAPVKDSVGVNPLNQMNVNNGSVMPNNSVEPKKPVSDNVVGGNSINQSPNSMGQVNNQNLNSFPFENINQLNNTNPQPAPNSAINNLNVIGDAPKDLNDPLTGGASNNLNKGMSQVGVTQMNNPDNDVVEMPEIPDKKFPLSTREMILIGVALVGIVVVVIMYWPK